MIEIKEDTITWLVSLLTALEVSSDSADFIKQIKPSISVQITSPSDIAKIKEVKKELIESVSLKQIDTQVQIQVKKKEEEDLAKLKQDLALEQEKRKIEEKGRLDEMTKTKLENRSILKRKSIKNPYEAERAAVLKVLSDLEGKEKQVSSFEILEDGYRMVLPDGSTESCDRDTIAKQLNLELKRRYK